MYDITDEASFKAVDKWMKDIQVLSRECRTAALDAPP